jgi:hypothetical protein
MKREEKKQTIEKEANASMSHSSNSMHQKRQWTAESATQKPAAEAKKDTTPKKPTPKYEDDLAFEEKKIAPSAYTYNNQASTYNA